MKSLNFLIIALKYAGKKMHVKFSGSCLKQNKITFNQGKTVNVYIAFYLKLNLNNFDPTLKTCLFGAAKMAKNNDIDQYEYSCYGIGFDSKGTFSHPSGTTGANVIIFVADKF